ncbi:hypothetical protein [Legionella oakridgensis]|uniref:hypothetical protein n=1 Tax=Legionella oakridgensis TaxID=29423 RepID=UPI0003DE43AF|nr:hypothetical protein [Legionella oakridgensis]ETO92119.1 hypothetical protein LOR_35c03200 [Legionella oakridgensis RV-2-2007]
MITIALSEESRLAVKLTVDLKGYCESYKRWRDSRKALEDIDTSGEPRPAVVMVEERRRATQLVEETENAFKQIRASYTARLSALPGDLHWHEIKNLLSTRCNLLDPGENRLFSFLSGFGSEAGASPLVLESLDCSFVELLKNSMDALLLNYLKNAATEATTTLEMRVALNLAGETLSVAITDNAGGFSAAYLTSFNETIKSRNYNKTHSREKCQYMDYCFGGAGRGLPILVDYIVHGGFSRRPDVFEKIYQVKEGDTSIDIHNTLDAKGAEIIITTPMAPFAAAETENIPLRRIDSASMTSHEDEDEDEASEVVEKEFEVSLPASFVLASPPKPRQVPPLIFLDSKETTAALAISAKALAFIPPGALASGTGAAAEGGASDKKLRLEGDGKRSRQTYELASGAGMELRLFPPTDEVIKRARKTPKPTKSAAMRPRN